MLLREIKILKELDTKPFTDAYNDLKGALAISRSKRAPADENVKELEKALKAEGIPAKDLKPGTSKYLTDVLNSGTAKFITGLSNDDLRNFDTLEKTDDFILEIKSAQVNLTKIKNEFIEVLKADPRTTALAVKAGVDTADKWLLEIDKRDPLALKNDAGVLNILDGFYKEKPHLVKALMSVSAGASFAKGAAELLAETNEEEFINGVKAMYALHGIILINLQRFESAAQSHKDSFDAPPEAEETPEPAP